MGIAGCGALTASVASTKTPITFIGTGEHVHDLEPFRARPFIAKMLGMGDLSGLADKVEEMQMNPDVQERQKEMMKKIEEGGTFTIRDWREQIGNIMKMCVCVNAPALTAGAPSRRSRV